MKPVFIFIAILGLGFFGVYMLTNQNNKPASQNSISNLATPSPQPKADRPLAETPTPTPTPNDFISAKSAIIKTAKGNIEIELYPQDAPKTVTNFATLSKRGYYNGLTFHRVEPGFVIQGGDPNGNGTGGTSIYGAKFEDELNANTTSYKAGYLEGVVAMANAGPNTNGSQFFIMLANNSLPHAYTIFGKVTKGMDVVKNIVAGDKMTSVVVE
jgi:cyclophilin family peptidyl-prolyl cis-trans isomerase